MNSLNLRWMLWMALGLVRVGAETPDLLSLAWTNGRPILEFRLVPSASEYRVRSSASPGVAGPLLGGSHRGGRWTAEAPSVGDSAFYRLEALILSNETVRASTLLNRIAYGPTPDELDRLATLGTDAYIEEQLAPEKIIEMCQPNTGQMDRKIWFDLVQ